MAYNQYMMINQSTKRPAMSMIVQYQLNSSAYGFCTFNCALTSAANASVDDDDVAPAIGGNGAERVNGCCDDRADNGGGNERAAVTGIVADNDGGSIRSAMVRPARISPCVNPFNRS